MTTTTEKTAPSHRSNAPRLLLAGLFICGLLGMSGCASTLRNQQARGSYIVDVLPQSCVIEVRGIIPVDGDQPIAAGLQQLRSAKCERMRIHIESGGGSVWAANQAGEAIRAAGAETEVDQLCASACTHMFMGGTRRWVSPQAQMGVHQLSLLGSRSPECLSLPTGSSLELRINRLFHQTLSYERLEAFLDLQNRTSCKSMAFIDAAQLLRMGIATDLRSM